MISQTDSKALSRNLSRSLGFLRQKNARPAWGTVAVAELRSCVTALQLLVRSGLHRLSVRLLPRPL